MKRERWFLLVFVLLVVLVAVFIVVSRLSSQPGTGNVVGFTCPDGSVVDSENDCPVQNVFSDIVVVPSFLDIQVDVGGEAEEIFRVVNNNQFPVVLTCDFDSIPWLEPESICVTYDPEGNSLIGQNVSIDAGAAQGFYVRVYTHDNDLLIQNGSKFRFTTHTGVYTRNVVLNGWEEGSEDVSGMSIPLRIEVD